MGVVVRGCRGDVREGKLWKVVNVYVKLNRNNYRVVSYT